MAYKPLAEPWGDWLARADVGTYLEQRIFALSPFSWVTTSLLLYAGLLCLYAGVAFLDRAPLVVQAASGFGLEPRARLAAILALIACVGLGLQRYSRIKDCEDGSAMSEVMMSGTPFAMRLARPMPSKLKLGRATILGIAVGLLLTVLLFWRSPDIGLTHHPLMFAWFAAEILLLVVLFARGVELSRAGGEGARVVIQKYLNIDLLR